MGRRRSCSSRGSSLRRGLSDSDSTFFGGVYGLVVLRSVSLIRVHIYYHYGNRSQKTILIMTLGTYNSIMVVSIYIYIYIYVYIYMYMYV